MIREGREVRPRTDYILGTDCSLFGNVSVRDPMHNSDHYMVLGCLNSSPLREHARYLGGCKLSPPPPTNRPNEGGRNLRGPTKGRTKASGKRRKEERVDLGGNVDSC